MDFKLFRSVLFVLVAIHAANAMFRTNTLVGDNGIREQTVATATEANTGPRRAPNPRRVMKLSNHPANVEANGITQKPITTTKIQRGIRQTVRLSGNPKTALELTPASVPRASKRSSEPAPKLRRIRDESTNNQTPLNGAAKAPDTTSNKELQQTLDLIGDPRTVEALEKLSQDGIPDNNSIEAIGNLARKHGFEVTTAHLDVAKDAANYLRTGQGDESTIVRNATDLIADAAANKGLLKPENADALKSGAGTLKNRYAAVRLGATLGKVLIGNDVLNTGMDLTEGIRTGNTQAIAGAGQKLVKGFLDSRYIPPTVKGPAAIAYTASKMYTTGELDVAMLEKALPTPKGTGDLLIKTFNAARKGDDVGKVLKEQAYEMAMHQVKGRVNSIPIVGGIIGSSLPMSLGSFQTGTASADKGTAEAVTVHLPNPFTAIEMKILREMIVEYAATHDIPLHNATPTGKEMKQKMETKTTVELMNRRVRKQEELQHSVESDEEAERQVELEPAEILAASRVTKRIRRHAGVSVANESADTAAEEVEAYATSLDSSTPAARPTRRAYGTTSSSEEKETMKTRPRRQIGRPRA